MPHTFDVSIGALAYDGNLIATSSAGGLATRALKVTPKSNPVPPNSDEVGLPPPPKLELARSKFLPSFLAPVGDLAARFFAVAGLAPLGLPDVTSWGLQWGTVRVSDDAKAGLNDLQLAGPSTVARLKVGTSELLDVEGASRAGTYTGKAKFGSGDSAETMDVSLAVRDIFLWPFLVLLLGLWAASKLDDFLRRRRPLAMLKVRRRKVEEEAVRLQDELHEWLTSPPLPPWPSDKRDAVVIYVDDKTASLIRDSGQRAVDQFQEIESPEERAKLYDVPLGSEVIKWDEYLLRLTEIKDLAELVSNGTARSWRSARQPKSLRERRLSKVSRPHGPMTARSRMKLTSTLLRPRLRTQRTC